MFASPLHNDPTLPERYTKYTAKKESQERIRSLKKRIQSTHDILQMEELKCRKRVLRRLGFTSSSDIVDTKGRVACEISSGDELLLTELIFNGAFNTLLPEQCAALLSCFVFGEKVMWSVLYRGLRADRCAERPASKVDRGIGSPSARHARDRKADSQGVEGVQAASR